MPLSPKNIDEWSEAIAEAAQRLAGNAGAIAVSAAVSFVVFALGLVGWQAYKLRDLLSEDVIKHLVTQETADVRSPWAELDSQEFQPLLEPVIKARLHELQRRVAAERAVLFIYKSNHTRVLAAEANAVNVDSLPVQIWIADTRQPGFTEARSAHFKGECYKHEPLKLPEASQFRISALGLGLSSIYSCPYGRHGYVSAAFTAPPSASDALIFEYLAEAGRDIASALGWE